MRGLVGIYPAIDVNYADPFGLCPIEKTGIPCAVVRAGQVGAAGAVLGAATTVIAAPETGGASLLLLPKATAFGALVGSSIGAAVGTVEDNQAEIAAEMGKLSRAIKILLIGLGAAQGETVPLDVRQRGEHDAPIEETVPRKGEPSDTTPAKRRPQ